MTRWSNPDPIDVYVGARRRERRKSLRLSQQDLSAKLGITFQQVQKYERGANRVSASMLVRAAGALGVTLDYFVADMPPAFGVLGRVSSDPMVAERARRLEAAADTMPQLRLIPDLTRAQQRAIAAVIEVCAATLPTDEELERQHETYREQVRSAPAAA